MTRTCLVIGGYTSPIPERDGGNRFDSVYYAMMLQICREYPGLPDVRTMRASQIKSFYDALRAELEKR